MAGGPSCFLHCVVTLSHGPLNLSHVAGNTAEAVSFSLEPQSAAGELGSLCWTMELEGSSWAICGVMFQMSGPVLPSLFPHLKSPSVWVPCRVVTGT